MKNKRLIILLSIFSFIILIVVLSSTVFTVKTSTISVEWHSTTQVFSPQEDNKNIISVASQKENVMFYDKNLAKTNIEEKFPYAKVLKVERKFPNKIVLHLTERQEQYAIKVDDEYYVLDDSAKVLCVYSAEQFADIQNDSERFAPAVVEIEGLTVEAGTMQTGKTAQITRVVTVLQNLSTGLKQCGFDEAYKVLSKIDNIKISFVFESKLILNLSHNNVSICIKNITDELPKKVRAGFYYVESKACVNKLVTVTQNADGKIVCEAENINAS